MTSTVTSEYNTLHGYRRQVQGREGVKARVDPKGRTIEPRAQRFLSVCLLVCVLD